MERCLNCYPFLPLGWKCPVYTDCFCHLEFIGNPKTFQTTLGGVNLSLRVSAQHDKMINQPCFCFGNGVISVHENFSLKSKICKVEEIINLHTKAKTSQANLRTNYRYPSIESHKLPPSLSLDPPPHNLSAALKIGRVGFQVARSTSKQTPACVAALFPYWDRNVPFFYICCHFLDKNKL